MGKELQLYKEDWERMMDKRKMMVGIRLKFTKAANKRKLGFFWGGVSQRVCC